LIVNTQSPLTTFNLTLTQLSSRIYLKSLVTFFFKISLQIYKIIVRNKTTGPRGPWVAHLRKRSKVTVEPIIENPRGNDLNNFGSGPFDDVIY